MLSALVHMCGLQKRSPDNGDNSRRTCLYISKKSYLYWWQHHYWFYEVFRVENRPRRSPLYVGFVQEPTTVETAVTGVVKKYGNAEGV